MDLAERIKKIREDKRFSKTDIANILEIDLPNYVRLEKRGSKLTYEQIEKISDALEISPKYLLFGEEENVDANKIQLLEKEIELLKKEKQYLELETSKLKEDEIFAKRILKLLEMEEEFSPEILKKINEGFVNKVLTFGLAYISIEEWFKQNKEKKEKGENKRETPKFTVKKES